MTNNTLAVSVVVMTTMVVATMVANYMMVTTAGVPVWVRRRPSGW